MSHATLYRIDARGSSVDSFGFDKNDGGFSINNTFDKMTSNTKKKNKNKNKNANKNKNGGKLSCAWTLRLDSDTWDNANYLRRIARIHSKMYYPTLIDRANYILDKWEDILQVNDRNLTRMWMYPPHMIGQRLFLFVSFLFLFLLFFIVFYCFLLVIYLILAQRIAWWIYYYFIFFVVFVFCFLFFLNFYCLSDNNNNNTNNKHNSSNCIKFM